MTDTPDAPRIRPLTDDEMSDDQRQLLEPMGPGASMGIFATLARHPGLFRRWMPFAGKLLQGGKLSDRDRELLILRTAYLCDASYEWGQHVAIGRAAGLTDEELGRIPAGPDAEGWTTDDATLLRAVDELQRDHRIGDATWADLAERYSEEQLLELPMVSGHYAMLAGVLNSLGVRDEDGLPRLGEI